MKRCFAITFSMFFSLLAFSSSDDSLHDQVKEINALPIIDVGEEFSERYIPFHIHDSKVFRPPDERGRFVVMATFPNIPDFICDSWCYESDVYLIEARSLDGSRIELRHRSRKYPNVIVITTVTPEPGALEFSARMELEKEDIGSLPENNVNLNLCWQLKRAPGFCSKPDSYPDFIKRCFIFTEKGRVFLDKTERRNLPRRVADDFRNNPPWVQSYVDTWKEIPEVSPTAWTDNYSPDKYVTPVIGAVSRDGKYLAALANDSATYMEQAWHDCMHNNPLWLPAVAPPSERRWRLKLYVMENDPDALLKRAHKDFPNIHR